MASELQTCEVCDAPTGRTREEQLAVGIFQPLCELCFELANGVRRAALEEAAALCDERGREVRSLGGKALASLHHADAAAIRALKET